MLCSRAADLCFRLQLYSSLDSQILKRKVQRAQIKLLLPAPPPRPATMHSLPYCRHLPQKVHFLPWMNLKDTSPPPLVLTFCRFGQVYNDTRPLYHVE